MRSGCYILLCTSSEQSLRQLPFKFLNSMLSHEYFLPTRMYSTWWVRKFILSTIQQDLLSVGIRKQSSNKCLAGTAIGSRTRLCQNKIHWGIIKILLSACLSVEGVASQLLSSKTGHSSWQQLQLTHCSLDSFKNSGITWSTMIWKKYFG